MILIGRLAGDPEEFTTQSGISRSTFRLAVQRRFPNAQGVREADFLTVVAWRGTADFCNRYLSKGRQVAVEGRIEVRSYDAQDGSKRWVTEIIADSVEGLGSRGDGQQSNHATDSGPQEAPPEPSGNPGEFTEVQDDDLPF